jgi:hypothetical protein
MLFGTGVTDDYAITHKVIHITAFQCDNTT